MKLNTCLVADRESVPDLETAKKKLREASSDAEAADIYHSWIFPQACMRIWEETATVGTANIAFIPIGTQPYSPVLAAIANRANRYVLLRTEASKANAETLVETLELENWEDFDIGEGSDPIAILKIVEAELAARGHVEPHLVAFDITSGRKSTVATLGSIAAVKGFRQSYIQSDPIPGCPRYHHNEKVVWLPDIRNLLGEDHRALGLALLGACAFEAAAAEFEKSAELSGQSRIDVLLARASRGLALWLRGHFKGARREMAGALRHAKETPFETLLKQVHAKLGQLKESEVPERERRAIEALREALAQGAMPPKRASDGPVALARQLAEKAREI